MPAALFSFKVDSDGHVRIAHVFFASTKAAAEAEMRSHAEICPKFGPALRTNQTIEYVREIPNLPPADGDDLEEWVDDFLASDDDEPEDDAIDMVPD